ILEEHVNITRPIRPGQSTALDDERARHAATELVYRATVGVRMVPERACGMIGRDEELIIKPSARPHGDQHVIAVAGRRDPQAVGVDVGVVDAAAMRCRPRTGRQAVLQAKTQHVPGPNADRWSSKAAAREIAAFEATQLDGIVAQRPRVPQLPAYEFN